MLVVLAFVISINAVRVAGIHIMTALSLQDNLMRVLKLGAEPVMGLAAPPVPRIVNVRQLVFCR